MTVEPPSAAAQALAAIPLFAPLSPVDLAKLAGVLEDQWFDAGTVVFEVGGTGDALYVLREGIAERRVAGLRLGTIEPPEVFGELALLTDQPRSSSVVAQTPIRVWVLPKHRMLTLLRAEPELLFDLSRALGMELASARRALAEVQRELDAWVSERMVELVPAQRAMVAAAALCGDVSARGFARLTGDGDGALVPSMAEFAPLLRERAGRVGAPATLRDSLVRWLEREGQDDALRKRLAVAARALEGDGLHADALAAYRAANADADVRRMLAKQPGLEAAAGASPIAQPAFAPTHRRNIDVRKVAGGVLAIAPLLFWNFSPPSGLSEAGWHALLTLVSAAIVFATDALPEAVAALALMALWVVGGVIAPRAALDGFATQAWILVLTVLAVGVAVGNSGLLYRVALFALGRGPATFARRGLTLALVGTAVTPTLPNATSRVALAAPMVREVAEALGIQAGSRAATGLAMASLVGFGQMAGLFLTGSSVGILVHGLLPAPSRMQFDFGGWFVAALPLHVVLFASALAATFALYRAGDGTAHAGDRLAIQREVLGPMRRAEKLCVAVMVGLIAGFLTEPWHGIHGAWVGVAALVVLAVGGALDTTMLRTGVNWPFLVFFGVITSLASVFQALGVDAWLAKSLAAPIGAVAAHSALFCVALALVGFVMSFLIRWQAAAPLLTLVALPVAGIAHVDPFLVALICLVSTQAWFLPYQSTVYLAFYHGSGELFTHRDARALAWLWGPLVLVSILAAWPVWLAMGLVR